jgi:hypothetical protein
VAITTIVDPTEEEDLAMTTDSAPPPAPPPPVVERPGMVTAAGITLIVLGALTLLISLFLLIGIGLFAGAAGSIPESDMPAGFGGMMGAFAGMFFVLMLVVLAFGVLQLASGIKVLGGRSWARVTGIVVAAIAGLLAVSGLANSDGIIFSLILVAANGFVIWALLTTGPWFAARSAS